LVLLGSDARLPFLTILAALTVLGAVLPPHFGVTYEGPNSSTHAAYPLVSWPEGWALRGLAVAAIAFLLAAAWPRPKAPRTAPRALATALYAAALAAMAGTAVVTLSRTATNWRHPDGAFRDWRSDPLLARIA